MYWNSDDIILSILGGILLSFACTINYMLRGKITGYSGIYYEVITFNQDTLYWKLSYLSSIVIATTIMYKIYGITPIIEGASPAFDSVPQLTGLGYTGYTISGLLLGMGTKLGNGCTSGHIFCGLARVSPRSIIATILFLILGISTSTITYQITNFRIGESSYDYDLVSSIFLGIAVGLQLISAIGQFFIDKYKMIDVIIGFVVGFIFGIGLVVSGMIKPSKVLGFLTIYDGWDPSLIFVFITVVFFNFITFRISSQPMLAKEFEIPPYQYVDKQMILGVSLFGVGWGMSGLCPAPAIGLFAQFTWDIGLVYLGSVSFGSRIGCKIMEHFFQKEKIMEIQEQNRFGQ